MGAQKRERRLRPEVVRCTQKMKSGAQAVGKNGRRRLAIVSRAGGQMGVNVEIVIKNISHVATAFLVDTYAMSIPHFFL